MSAPQFDRQKAEEAKQALDATAALIRVRTERRAQLAGQMKSWKGPHADTFWKQSYPAMTNEAAHVIKLLNGLWSAINSAVIDAGVDAGKIRHGGE